MTSPTTTKAGVLAAAKGALIESGYSRLSTRRIAEMAGVPLSQIHYHFGSKQNLVLEVLAEENRRLLQRQTAMYASEELPLWKRWEQACDFLDDDLDSGYVRVLQEMMAAGWSDPDIAGPVRTYLEGWFTLLRTVAASAIGRSRTIDVVESSHVAALVGAAFLGAEAMILLGFEDELTRQALRSLGGVIRHMEEDGDGEGSAPGS